eukprot:5302955-Prymnesium_polylepis.1
MLLPHLCLTRCCAFAGCGTSITNNCARTEAGRAGRRACRAAFEQARRSSSYRRCIAHPSNETHSPPARRAPAARAHTLPALPAFVHATAPGRPDLHDGHVAT